MLFGFKAGRSMNAAHIVGARRCWLVVCWCVTGEWWSRRCVLLKRSAESFLTAPYFRLIALMCASKHNCHLSPPTDSRSQPRDKLRELESGINQTQMTWLASCDKYMQKEEEKEKNGGGKKVWHLKSEVKSETKAWASSDIRFCPVPCSQFTEIVQHSRKRLDLMRQAAALQRM